MHASRVSPIAATLAPSRTAVTLVSVALLMLLAALSVPEARRALLSSQVALYAALGGGTLAAAGEAQGAASTPASTPSTR